MFHIVKNYEIKAHFRGFYMMSEYSVFIQSMGLHYFFSFK